MASGLESFRKTRIAPTPSGFLHLGNALSFILTAGLAKRHGATVLLRIDDLDRERVRNEYVDDIFETLRFLGISWDEGPSDRIDFERKWSQKNRTIEYLKALNYLSEAGRVFGCSCSRTETGGEGYPGTCLGTSRPLETPGIAWRLRTASDESEFMGGISGQSIQSYIPKSVQYAVVRRRNGEPSYHLASVVDDIQFGVDFIVRGADLLDSSLLQIQLSKLLDDEVFPSAHFVHHPLVTGESGIKLSKSAGDTSIAGLRREGYSKNQVYAKLGATVGLERTYTNWEALFPDLAAKWLGK